MSIYLLALFDHLLARFQAVDLISFLLLLALHLLLDQ